MNKKSLQKLRRGIQMAYEAGIELGDPMILYNERYLEYLIADELGHTKDGRTQGADAYNEKGLPVEYKSINIDSEIRRGTPGCWQWHWNKPKKLKKLKQLDGIFCVKRQCDVIKEIYTFPVSTAVQIAEDKILNESKTGLFDKSGFSFTVDKLLELGGKQINNSG